jgi:RNA polymerase sigma factor (sigma-70 family)
VKEIELIRNCKRNDRKSQQLLYERFADRMYRLGFRYIHGHSDTEDVIIISFNKVFSKLNTFSYQGEGSLEAWIRKIVVNESLMWLRSRHNFNLTENVDETVEEPDLTPIRDLGADDIYKMVAELPTGYRTVFNLNVVEGYNHSEISGMLGISEGTSRSQLFKAKVILKKILTQEGFFYGT